MSQSLHIMPEIGMRFGVDPLSALFLLLLLPQAVAGGIAGGWRSGMFRLAVAGMALTLLAGDAFTRVAGLALTAAGFWLPVLRGGGLAAAAGFAGIGCIAVFCLIPALALPAGDPAFALLLLGSAAMAGLAPLFFRCRGAAGEAAGALLFGGLVELALYMFLRGAFLQDAAAIRPWWGVALLLPGLGAVLLGGRSAVLAAGLDGVLAGSAVAQSGLLAIGLGLALHGRAVDDPALAVLALQGTLLGAVAHGLFVPLLFLGAGAVRRATGTSRLDWLGGLLRGMPQLGGAMLLGATGMAGLPLGPWFAAQFLILHAAIAGAGGGILSWLGFACLLGGIGIGIGLGLAAAIRVVGIGFLGRPRSLHAAAAEEAPRRIRFALGLLAFGCLPVALAPCLLLAAMQPVLAQLVPQALPLPLAYAPLPLAALLLAPALGAFGLLRRHGARGGREAPAWNGGFGRPPAWLPFGEPSSQLSATGFSQPVEAALGGLRPAVEALFAARRRLPRMRRLRSLGAGRAGDGRRLLPGLAFGALLLALLRLCLNGGG